MWKWSPKACCRRGDVPNSACLKSSVKFPQSLMVWVLCHLLVELLVSFGTCPHGWRNPSYFSDCGVTGFHMTWTWWNVNGLMVRGRWKTPDQQQSELEAAFKAAGGSTQSLHVTARLCSNSDGQIRTKYRNEQVSETWHLGGKLVVLIELNIFWLLILAFLYPKAGITKFWEKSLFLRILCEFHFLNWLQKLLQLFTILLFIEAYL